MKHDYLKSYIVRATESKQMHEMMIQVGDRDISDKVSIVYVTGVKYTSQGYAEYSELNERKDRAAHIRYRDVARHLAEQLREQTTRVGPHKVKYSVFSKVEVVEKQYVGAGIDPEETVII